MFSRVIFAVFLIFFSGFSYGASCLDVFPTALQGNELGSGNELINFPVNNSTAHLTDATVLSRGDNLYLDSLLGNQDTLSVGAVTGSETTARLFIGSSVSWQNVKINEFGSPEDLIIVIDGSLSITGGNTVINAIIYVKGTADLSALTGAVTVNGSVTTLGAVTTTSANINYQQSYITNADFNGMCAAAIPISCSTASLPSLAYSDDFAQLNSGWQTVNFNRSISNWPNESIYNTPSENQNVVGVVTLGQLFINGSYSTGGDNEYGFVQQLLATQGITNTVTNNYAVAFDLTADKIGLNNDIGLVFGYVNDSNYYLARWTKYGDSYINDTTFPGKHRSLELIKVSSGVATTLDSIDNVDINDPFNLKVVVNNQGTAVCVNDVAQLYSASEQPVVHDVGIFSYDNDDGISADNLALYCDNCKTVLADYHFDECSYAGVNNEVVDSANNYPATGAGGVNSGADSQINRALNLLDYSDHVETSIPLSNAYSVSAWFKKPTSTSDSQYFVLGAMSSGGDLLFINRSNSWRWGVYNGTTNVNGTFSFATLDSNWHHLALVYQNGVTKLYIDGVFTDSVNDIPVASGTLKYIGTSFDYVNTTTAQGFRAPIDEFMVFSGALTATEITAIYTNQLAAKNYDGTTRSAVVCNDLVGFYQFEQTSFATNVTDSSTYNNNGTNIGGASIAAGKYCRGFDTNGTNSSSTTTNAFSSNIDLDSQVGARGTISFWYKANNNWDSGGYNGTGERTLFDASLYLYTTWSTNKFFDLRVQPDGHLRFAFEDAADTDFYVEETPGTVRTANTWYYITVTWDYISENFQLFVDGNLKTSANLNTNGAIFDVGNIVFGDNASAFSGNGLNYLASENSANGQFDEVRIYRKVLTQTEIQTDMNDKAGCISVDHYQIEHDGNGLTCDSETVTIKACADASCSILSSDTVTLDLQGNGSTLSSATFTGSTSVTFNHTTAETLALSVANPTITPNNGFVCKNGASTSCNMVFTDAGFRFLYGAAESTTIANQVAGSTFADTLKIQAVENTNGVCTGLFNGNVTVALAQKNTSPTGTGGLSFTVNGSAIAKHPTFTNTTLNFGADSKATITNPVYNDAGQIQLYASYSAGGVNLVGNSNAFWVSPAKLIVSAKSGVTDLNNTTASGTPIHKAGQVFDLQVSALNASGNVTPNYQPGQIQFKLQRTGPVNTGVDGSLTYAAGNSITSSLTPSFTNVSLTNFINGVSTYNSASFSEVGLLNLDLQDSNYGGAGITVNGDAINIGRFTPDHFVQTVATNGTLVGTCGAGSWVYTGQKDEATQSVGAISYGTAPVLTITAYNANNVITKNYTTTGGEGFMRLLNTGISITSPTNDLNQIGASSLTDLTANMSTGTLSQASDGVQSYTFSANDNFTYTRNANAKIAPYTAEIPLAVNSITDQDSVTATTTTQAVSSGVEVRYGRMALANSFGPETANLAQPLSVEYLNASGNFVLNSDDSCTGVNSSKVSLTNISVAPNGTNSVVGDNFVNGVNSAIELNATGAGNQGQIKVTYDAFPWLEYDWNNNSTNVDPFATATFGIFRGNDRIIYWREVNN